MDNRINRRVSVVRVTATRVMQRAQHRALNGAYRHQGNGQPPQSSGATEHKAIPTQTATLTT